MAKNEKIVPKEPDYSKVKLRETSLQDLVSYKKIADLMFEHYDAWSKSFIGDYDPVTKANYEIALDQANYFRLIREAIRSEMEMRLLQLDESVLIWEMNFAKDNEETLD